MGQKLLSTGRIKIFLKFNALVSPLKKASTSLSPTLVTSFNDYVRKFGSSFNSGSAGAAQAGVKEYFTTLAVKNYFSQGGGSVLVSRVVGNAHSPASNTFVTASIGNRSTQVFTFETIGKNPFPFFPKLSAINC